MKGVCNAVMAIQFIAVRTCSKVNEGLKDYENAINKALKELEKNEHTFNGIHHYDTFIPETREIVSTAIISYYEYLKRGPRKKTS